MLKTILFSVSRKEKTNEMESRIERMESILATSGLETAMTTPTTSSPTADLDDRFAMLFSHSQGSSSFFGIFRIYAKSSFNSLILCLPTRLRIRLFPIFLSRIAMDFKQNRVVRALGPHLEANARATYAFGDATRLAGSVSQGTSSYSTQKHC